MHIGERIWPVVTSRRRGEMGLENLARYIIRACFSQERMVYIPRRRDLLSGSTDIQTYDGEKLWSYELGIKEYWLDNRLVMHGAVYYMGIDEVDEILQGRITIWFNHAVDVS